ncbi:hypothetical protein A1C_05965 [Rickettsia akari str. Hartford]|uniref:Uncharacterized protein n=1 Tax=Rickettsia akari (strain Hartford) TaxID=293614 RepID=A8GPV1_RICAH|nr:hypothetical protein [Rickettsia akari]ABV75426.1 hypothetical protein A1C_05965 [Rickettsia akari str. Hartford]
MSKQSNDMDTLAELERIKSRVTTLSKEIKSKPVKSMVTTATPHSTNDHQTSNQMHNDYEAQQTKLAGKGAKKFGCEIM